MYIALKFHDFGMVSIMFKNCMTCVEWDELPQKSARGHYILLNDSPPPPPLPSLSPFNRVFDAIRGRSQQPASQEQQSTDTTDTQPRELPAELWASSLQSLYLHSNRLKWLPSYLGKLGALTRLDISRYTRLPPLSYKIKNITPPIQ